MRILIKRSSVLICLIFCTFYVLFARGACKGVVDNVAGTLAKEEFIFVCLFIGVLFMMVVE